MTELLVILLLVLVNGIFAGAEIAVLSVRKTRLRELVEDGSTRARAVLDLRSHPERFLATVQVGITVVSATAAAFGGASVAAQVEPLVAMVPGLQAHAENIAFGLVVALVSYLSLVLGELVPKSLALRSAESYALLISRPLRWLSQAARPLAWLLTASSNLVLRPFGDRTTFTESRLSAEELQLLVEEAAKHGELDTHSGEIASRALEFGELDASEVMVPRNRIDAVAVTADEAEVRRTFLESGRTRMPVYAESLDDIVGYLRVRDVFEAMLAGKPVAVRELMRPIHFVPRTMPAVEVLRELQRLQMQMVIVVDEHGGVSGLITLEDLVEELIGEIFGEHEQRERDILTEAEGVYLVRGSTPLREINRELDLDLDEDQPYTTLGGLCTALAGGIPQKGARLVEPVSHAVLEVVSATPRAVGLVRLLLPEMPRDDEA